VTHPNEPEYLGAGPEVSTEAVEPGVERLPEETVAVEEAGPAPGRETAPPGAGPSPEEPPGEPEGASASQAAALATAEAAPGPAEPERPDLSPELRRLVDLATRYPEIGPPLAELAFKVGEREWAERIVRMGLDQEAPGMEFYAVLANAARRERRTTDALEVTLEALHRFATAPETTVAPEDGPRLLQVIRQAFAHLMFDLQALNAYPEFITQVATALSGLEDRLGKDPLYHVLLAQALWNDSRERSEAEWDRAIALAENDLAWNARGTWYKEAEKDLDRAERVYRQGLEQLPHSPLLLHNLAQVLLEKAARPDVEAGAARRLVREAETLLRQGLREEGPRGMRRYIHATLDRLAEIRALLPPRPGKKPRPTSGEAETSEPTAPPPPPPEVGAVLRGRVESLTVFGAFVDVGGHVGLLHKSEMSPYPVRDPSEIVKTGDEVEVKVIRVEPQADGRLRIGLSRKALMGAPAGPPEAAAAPAPRPEAPRPRGRPPGAERGRSRELAGRRDDRNGGRREDRRPERRDRDERREPPDPRRPEWPSDKANEAKIAKLGEILLAKLKGQLPEE
jgi:predicted RNA-binding protein with RPS1 domain/tetratricopeptide (TPR) repeat protein